MERNFHHRGNRKGRRKNREKGGDLGKKKMMRAAHKHMRLNDLKNK